MAVVIRGAVSISVHGLLKHKRLSGEWGVLYDGGGKGDRLPRIELYAEKNATSPVHVLVLEHLKFSDKSYQQQEAHFSLSIKKDKHLFQFDSVVDKDDWVQSLCHISPELWKQRSNSMTSDFESSEGSDDMMQDNFLYDSCGTVQQFKVSVCPTRASEANKLQGNYLLSPSKDAVRLLDMVTFKCLHEWPYKQIRKYGRTRLVFKLEVGRKCSTGPGEFEFFTPDGTTLTDWVTMYMKQAKESFGSKQSQEELSPHSGSDLSSASMPVRPRPSPRSKMDVSPTPPVDDDYNSEISMDRQYYERDDKLSKDRKKQEKAAEKLKKQQEKEAGEREARERKEREKQQKKGFKTKSSQPETLSTTHQGLASSEGNIYDEPGNLPMPPKSTSPHAEHAESNPHHGHPLDVYSLPEKPQKGGWKKHARPEVDNIHTEDYNSIKAACQSQHKPRNPLTSPQVSSACDDGDDTYNRLGDFSRQTSAASHQENVYGMASAKDTIALTSASAYRPPPVGAHRPPPVSAFAGGNEYDDADELLSEQSAARAVRDEYEDTSGAY